LELIDLYEIHRTDIEPKSKRLSAK